MSESTTLDESTARALAQFFSALSDPTRLRLISTLSEEQVEYSVQELADRLGMTHSAVSHQLRLLRQLRVVRVRPEGRHKFYSLDDEHVRRLYREGLDHLRHS